MIKANLDVVIENLGKVNNYLGDLTGYLQKLKKAEEITDLTDDQKTAILAEVNTYATKISTAYTDLVAAFQADTEIINEE